MTGIARVLAMFSVATLALATPVYIRLLESPGLTALLWLAVLVQVLPTIGLVLVDVGIERRWRGAWWGWRGTLVAVCLVAAVRQTQVSFRLMASTTAWTLVPLCGVALGVLALSIRHVTVSQQFLAALAPALLVWTVSTGYDLLPTAARTPLQTPPARRPAVFVLLFDELDADLVMPHGTVRAELPNFRRLAEGSRSFTDATANYGSTCASVSSLLVGRLLDRTPPVGRGCLRHVRGFREDNLLTEVARRLTVRLHAQYIAYCFDAAFRCGGTARVQARAPYLALLQHYVPDSLRTATGTERMLGFSEHTYTLPVFEEFLASVRTGDAYGTLHWVHVLIPHAPYVFDAQGTSHRPDYPEYWRDEARYRPALAAYRRQVGFVDRLLGTFLDRLDAKGLTRDAIVIVTSDHGFVTLHPPAGGELIDGFDVGAGRTRVPLIIRAPGVTPGRVTDDYQHVDFKRLVLGLIDDGGVPSPIAPAREKIFCDTTGVWYERDRDSRWRPQLGPDGHPRGC